MKKSIYKGFTFSLLIFISCDLGRDKTNLLYEDLIDKMSDAIRYEIKDKNLNAISIAIIKRDDFLWAEGFGFIDEDRKIKADENTIYRVGSISKLFTDLAIMKKRENGDIDIDLPIQNYLPKFNPKNVYDKSITLRQLMSHRAGILREPAYGNYFEDNEEDKLGRNIEDNEEDNENEKQNDLLDIESYSFQNNMNTISQILGTEDLNCDIETLMGLNGNMDKIQYADEFNEGIVFEKYDNLLKRGNMDDNVKKWVEKYFNLRIDWTTELKNYIQKLLPYDMNWSSPNRKMLGQGIYLPSMLKENIKIILAFDTSGSINEENLKLFLNETQNIIQSINNLELIVIDCDSKIQKISNYKSGENVLDHIFLGGGGTDFRPVFQYAESIEPNLVIYFTDGDGVIPTDNYQFDTIWMIINDNKMPFGNVINMI